MSKRASRRIGVGLLAAGLLLPVVLFAQTFSYTGPAVAIPDSPSSGVDVFLPVSGLAGTIADIDFQLDPIVGTACTNGTNSAGASIAHTWIGDLLVTITQPGGGTSVTVIDRPGFTGSGLGCSQNNFCTVLLDDEAGGGAIENQCGTGAIAGNFTPNNPLSAFDGLAAATANGNWAIHVTDLAGGDTGSIRAFSLIFTMAGGQGCALTCPADQVVPTAGGTCSAPVNYPAPQISGQCGQVFCTPASGSTFPLGPTLVTCEEQIPNAPEGGGASCSFNVTVVDQEPPVVTAPDATVGNDAGLCSAVVLYGVTTSDNCPGVGPANCAPPSGTAFPVGSTPVNCSVTDASGNVGNDGGTITVNDVEAPVITCPADIEEDLPPGTTEGIVDYDPPVVTDNCSATYDCQPPSGSLFPSGTTPVVCIATDPANNQNTCSFDVILNEVSILEVPALSRTGLAALALLLAGAAILLFRRQG
ncbi:MAG: IPTL-CTERM sorting domain-containing protein [Thermoanaerobaculia bacterium]